MFAGESFEIEVDVSGASKLTVDWKKDGVPVGGWVKSNYSNNYLYSLRLLKFCHSRLTDTQKSKTKQPVPSTSRSPHTESAVCKMNVVVSPSPSCCRRVCCVAELLSATQYVFAACRSGQLCSTCSAFWSSNPQLQFGNGTSFIFP